MKLFAKNEHLFYKKNDHLREWKPVLVELQKIYNQVLEIQLQLYRSQITIKKIVRWSYCQQYSSILLLQAV